MPKLLIHSDQDQFADPKYVRAFYRSLPAPKAFHLAHAAHDYRYSPAAMLDIHQAVTGFLTQYGL